MSLERGKWFYMCMVAKIGESNWSCYTCLLCLPAGGTRGMAIIC